KYDDKRRLFEALQQFSTAFVDSNPMDLGDDGIAYAYGRLFNRNFFTGIPARTSPQDGPTPTQYISTALTPPESPLRPLLPSLATMRDDLAAQGDNRNNVLQQNEFNKTIAPTIDRLDMLRSELDKLDGALKSIDVKDRASLAKALVLTIQARRRLAGLPLPL